MGVTWMTARRTSSVYPNRPVPRHSYRRKRRSRIARRVLVSTATATAYEPGMSTLRKDDRTPVLVGVGPTCPTCRDATVPCRLNKTPGYLCTVCGDIWSLNELEES